MMMNYLIEANIVFAALFLLYAVLAGRDTFFGLRRTVLWLLPAVAACAPLPFLGPVVEGLPAAGQAGAWTGQIALPEVVVQDQAGGGLSTWPDVLYIIYIIGVAALLGRMAAQLVALARLRSRCPEACVEGRKVHILPDGEAPFSFFGQIYLCPQTHKDGELDTVLAHESAHARQWHSADVVMSQALCAICWFNPVAWMYAKAVRRNLEYLADEAVIRQGFERKSYQYQLLNMTLNTAAATLYNHFNVLPLKTRIRMMNKRRSRGIGRLKYLLALPAAALLAAACQNKESKGNDQEAKGNEMEEVMVVGYASDDRTEENSVAITVENPVGVSTDEGTGTTPLGKVYDMVEQAPSFPGGPSELMTYLSKNIKYPKEAQAAKQEGRVIVQFVVTSTGGVADIKVMRGVSPVLDQEAIRVVKNMPKWTPGRQDGEAVNVRYTLPVTFRLSK